MTKNLLRSTAYVVLLLIFTSIQASGKIVVFYEKGFPSVDNGVISRESLEKAFAQADARFVNLDELKSNLHTGDLLVLPFGSAFPADAWDAIRDHLNHGNLLILGGRPLYVPVYHDSGGWRTENAQNTYSHNLGIMYSYAVTEHGPWKLKWDEDAPFFHEASLNPRQVFANAGFGWRYRGVGFLVDTQGDRLAAPIVADDAVGRAQPARRAVFLSFDSESSYWASGDGIELMREAAAYASQGGVRIWLDIQQLTVDQGGHVSGAVDVLRNGEPAKLTLEIMSGSKVIESRTTSCGNSLHEEIGLHSPLNKPGLYLVRATLSHGDTAFDRYTSGVEVRDEELLESGDKLSAGRDYFLRDGKPYLMTGTNYFSTDPNTSDFFVGGSLGGNAYVWERDFTEMERQGITVVRTGTWLNRARYLDEVTGAADERLLRAVEAYLDAAARHHMQVIFTLFAFDPQVELQQGQGQEGDMLGPGSNPYLDPVAVDAETEYVKTIASRFSSVPFLSFDLINEPSFSNPKMIWKGNSPNGDPNELAAWHEWLQKRYVSIDTLASAWHVSPAELGNFENVPVPAATDMELSRYGNTTTIRALDFNLFAQDAFIKWTDTIIQAIRSTGSKQLVTVGQDEGGVVDRVLAQFWANSDVDFTVNHTWWHDDALLWSSMASKTTFKPNLIEETGPQPVWNMDGRWRWDDAGGTGLIERKLVLGFAGGNAGTIQWDWSRSDDFGLLRRDGSYKDWMLVMRGLGTFAHDAESYATSVEQPEIAIVFPQSLQLSPFGKFSILAQGNAVRALYQHARGSAFVVGEYQLSQMPPAKLIIVPSPWILTTKAWDVLMDKASSGATVLISGRADADEHWLADPSRTKSWDVHYSYEDLTSREAELRWPGDSARLSYPDDITTYLQRGVLSGDNTFLDIPVGRGHLFYFALPLELSTQLDAVGRIYKYAMDKAGITAPYTTTCDDPGILICPTRLPDATLYVLTSESSNDSMVSFHDNLSGANVRINISPGRAALLLVDRNGNIKATYNAK